MTLFEKMIDLVEKRNNLVQQYNKKAMVKIDSLIASSIEEASEDPNELSIVLENLIHTDVVDLFDNLQIDADIVLSVVYYDGHASDIDLQVYNTVERKIENKKLSSYPDDSTLYEYEGDSKYLKKVLAQDDVLLRVPKVGDTVIRIDEHKNTPSYYKVEKIRGTFVVYRDDFGYKEQVGIGSVLVIDVPNEPKVFYEWSDRPISGKGKGMKKQKDSEYPTKDIAEGYERIIRRVME